MEIWKDIDGYNGVYQISSYGRVRVDRRVRLLSFKGYKLEKKSKSKPYVAQVAFGKKIHVIGRFSTKEEAQKAFRNYVMNELPDYYRFIRLWDGEYLNCLLSKNNKRKAYRVHRLVAKAFIPNPENKPVVNHLDGNKFNNTAHNLAWCTSSENSKHAVKHDLVTLPKPKRIPVYCITLNKTFSSSYKAAEFINNEYYGNTKKVPTIACAIRMTCHGKRAKAYGQKWKYIDLERSTTSA